MQRREADLRLGLHPGSTQPPQPSRFSAGRRDIQQRCLADPRLAAQQQTEACQAAPGKQRLDQLQLIRAPQQVDHGP